MGMPAFSGANVGSITAIVQGAVLHKLGLNFVKSRVMPRSYGVTHNVVFRPGVHPTDRQVEGLDGVTRCENVMKWYVRKVRNPYT